LGAWHCGCSRTQHDPRLVVLTGGPGAGKTAVLEIIRHHFCEHVLVLPEAAGLIFKGGFPRRPGSPARQAAQRAIFRVQRELEWLALEEKKAAIVLCDRGTLDGVAYWPQGCESFFAANGTTRDEEMKRYSAVIHLRTPPASVGYNHTNPLRIESAEEAAAIDGAILDVWAEHPQRVIVDSTDDFIEKAARAVAAVRDLVPACCRPHHRHERP
jgi:predicted ATPase